MTELANLLARSSGSHSTCLIWSQQQQFRLLRSTRGAESLAAYSATPRGL